jgi:oligosaccharide repeat unit polymerase
MSEKITQDSSQYSLKVCLLISVILGVSYYLFTPLLVGFFNLADRFPYQEIFKSFYVDLSIPSYLVMVLCGVGVFFKGFNKKSKINSSIQVNDPVLLSAMGLFALAAVQIYSYVGMSSLLFKGYVGGEANELNGYKAIACGLNINLSFLFIYYYFGNNNKLLRIIVFLFFINNVILLSVGSRIYVLTALFSVLLAYMANEVQYKCKLNLKRLLYFFCFVIFFSCTIGLVRQGIDFNIEDVYYYLFAEPYFLWLSAGSILSIETIEFFRFPTKFISDFIGILPTAIFEDKYRWMAGVHSFLVELGLNNDPLLLYSPMGGTSIIYSLISEFGLIGALIFLYLMGAFFWKISYKAQESLFFKAYFLTLCSILPFIFFREDFFHIIKNFFFNSLIFPALILYFFRSGSSSKP